MKSVDKQLEILLSNVEIEEPRSELKKKLEKSMALGKPLVVKLGVDPTAPDLHLGHAVVLEKLAQFQNLGHRIVLIIGDFTARIGDPTGRNVTRPPLSEEEIEANAHTYLSQLSHLIDIGNVEIRRNSEWLGPLTFEELIKLASRMTVAQILQRTDFKNRMSENLPISMHEILYPLMQGYDSVMIDADIELGGTDQLFNNLVGRMLQSAYDKPSQMVLCLPLLVGTDGTEKMSKSKNNCIGLTENPNDMFGKVMSIPDPAMESYLKLSSGWSSGEVEERLSAYRSGNCHPMELKMDLAKAVVRRFHSPDAARAAEDFFRSNYQRKGESIFSEVRLSQLHDSVEMPILDLVTRLEPDFSRSHAKRMITQSAVRIDGVPRTSFNEIVHLKSGLTIEIGKHRKVKLAE